MTNEAQSSFLPVVLAGGSGTRLWPLSRDHYPKQFHALAGENTLLQDTVRRLEGLNAATPLLVCNEEHRFLAAEQMRLIGHGDAKIILEPAGRNTAPAVALAALHAIGPHDDPLLFVMPADHHIADTERFMEAVLAALPLAEQGKLVTFGIVADHAETGYGYIKRGQKLAGGGFAVERFEEKPARQAAEEYLRSGSYYWNSGMFLFRASRYLAELERHRPDILEACRKAIAGETPDMQFIRVDTEAFAACPSDSIDYAVMEKTSDAVVIPLDAGWSDVGSWSALWELQERDGDGNCFRGDVLAVDSRDCLVRAGSRLVTVVGVDNLVVVETKDAVLVANKDRVQDVKQLVELMRRKGRHEQVDHREVYRPWGYYDSIDIGERFQVKRIVVKPGGKLSLQMHHHRAEHWVVVRGMAKVRKGDETVMVGENESTFIPLGEVHSLENPGKIPLELIEVQSGSYLGEDDIVRFEDSYGRV